jgi:hypothetical protein
VPAPPLLQVKTGVPRNVVILAAAVNVAAQNPSWVPPVVVTATTNGTHKKGSKHYVEGAVDLRSKHFGYARDKQRFVALVLERLGPHYQGFLEAAGTPNEHFHFEYDPA